MKGQHPALNKNSIISSLFADVFKLPEFLKTWFSSARILIERIFLFSPLIISVILPETGDTNFNNSSDLS